VRALLRSLNDRARASGRARAPGGPLDGAAFALELVQAQAVEHAGYSRLQTEDVPEPSREIAWTKALGVAAAPCDAMKRLLLIRFAARLGKDDVLREASERDPDAAVRAAASAAIGASAAKGPG
jgi:hypothetical protein